MDTVAVRGREPAGAPSNLPQHLSSFVNREADLRSLKRMLGTARMVTLIGTGGAGKSRLASELAKANLSQWPDGAWWVELEAATDVAGAVLATLELPGQGPAKDVVASWLAGKKALLVLDNCEQLVAECAAFAHAALERCPGLTILATSREALGVSGEVRWPVSSLRDADAVQLFEARARLVSPTFKLASTAHGPVSQICERLDGLPLAIEMAAARIDVMSEQELLTNLNDRFRLLTSGTRSAPLRQQTMAAAIDWSHRLLTDDEVRLFRRLSVFQGGFTSDGAQTVCADEHDTNLMGLLGGLVQKSMVMADRVDDGSTRFRLLESHHAYAHQRLLEADELQLLSKRHYEYFAGRLASVTTSWTGPRPEGGAPGAAAQKWKARESANLWSALAWARDNADDRGLSLALEVADFEFSDHARATAVLLDLLSGSAQTRNEALRAKAYNLAARLVARQGDKEKGLALADASVALARKVSDPELTAYILNGAGMVYYARRELDAAASLCDEAIALLEGSSNHRLAIEIKNSQGLLAIERGDHATARDILAEVVEHSRSEGDEPIMARHLESLANAQLGLGDVAGAAASWAESLSVYRDINDPFGTIWCLGGLALVASQRADHERAVRLAGVVDRMSREWSLSTSSLRSNQLEDARRQASTKLGARKAEGAWNDGQTMSPTRALEYALGADRPAAEAGANVGPLSRREREVASMVAAGMTNREIGERLFIAERTAEGHVERIRNKLGFRSRTEVAAWAVEHGLGPRKLDKPPSTSSV
jgi:predicted ATPase/DNA-binding CsgD family transcriptional regulator